MQDESNREHSAPEHDASRREFVSLSTAAGLAAATGTASARSSHGGVIDSDVEIKTRDGVCNAAFIHPAHGSHPGVLLWTDIFGLRPTMREMGKRLAAEGYSVLVPNPFYRTTRGPVVEDASTFNFQEAQSRAKMMQWSASITHDPQAAAHDAQSFVAFLDAQRQVDKARKLGTHGYCMGGPLVFRSAAAVPERFAAAATFHGGGLVTDRPDSPHLLAPKIPGHLYIAIAASDDERQPDAKDKLREAFGRRAVVEVYPGTIHGWCVPDMPLRDGKPIYSKPDAERAWKHLLMLYGAALA